jgi:hypothetical protein
MFQPRYPDVTDNQVTRRAELQSLFAACVRAIADGAETKEEKSICAEAIKGRSLSIQGFFTLIRVAARAQKPFALEEFVRGAVLNEMTSPRSLCVVDTWLMEGRRQNAADEAHDQFIVERIPVRRDGALDRLVPHLDALRQAIDSLHIWNPTGKRYFA